MRHFIIISILFTTLLSCSKEDIYTPIYEPGSMEYGFAIARKNGKEFVSSAVGIKNSQINTDSLFAIYLTTETEDGDHRENFSLGYFRLIQFDYSVKAGGYDWDNPDVVACFYSTSQDDGDVAEDRYLIDTSYPNRISIDDVDTSEWRASGTFDLSFNIKQPKRNPLNPDKVTFTQGIFEVDILD